MFEIGPKKGPKEGPKEGPPEDNEDKRHLVVDTKEGPPEDNEDKRSLAGNENTHVVRELKHFFNTRKSTGS